MKVLAFLQNQWVRDPDRVREMLARHPEARQRFIYRALFAGCRTGRRLQSAFGEDICRDIIWEEASPVITGDPNECPPADIAHIRAAIETHRPDVIIAFGRIAADAVRPLWRNEFLIVAPHPAARDGLTPARLREAAKALQLMREGATA